MAAVTAGPGLTNTVTAVKNAQMAESPLLLIGGAAATLLQVRKCVIDYETRTHALHAHVACVFALCSGWFIPLYLPYLFFIFLSVSCANSRYYLNSGVILRELALNHKSEHLIITVIKGKVTQKSCHHFLTLMFFQTCMTKKFGYN